MLVADADNVADPVSEAVPVDVAVTVPDGVRLLVTVADGESVADTDWESLVDSVGDDEKLLETEEVEDSVWVGVTDAVGLSEAVLERENVTVPDEVAVGLGDRVAV